MAFGREVAASGHPFIALLVSELGPFEQREHYAVRRSITEDPAALVGAARAPETLFDVK